jgi:transposase
MTRRQKDPLRPLNAEEREVLERISRAQSDPASHVARAKALLAVADGVSYTQAARAAGRRSGDAVAQLVSRFNREGLAAIEPRHGGGPPIEYGVEERKRILAEFERQPDREEDGTATWSLNTLQRALHTRPTGCPRSARTPSGACCTKLAGHGKQIGPGARPERWSASAKRARWR